LYINSRVMGFIELSSIILLLKVIPLSLDVINLNTFLFLQEERKNKSNNDVMLISNFKRLNFSFKIF
jgi:hypothetical protein